MSGTKNETSTTENVPAVVETVVLAPRTLGVARSVKIGALRQAETAFSKVAGKAREDRVRFSVSLAYAVASGEVIAPEGGRLSEHIVATFPTATAESKGGADNMLAVGRTLIVLGDEATMPIGLAIATARNYGVSVKDLAAQAEGSKGKDEARIVAGFDLLAGEAKAKREERKDEAKVKRDAAKDSAESEGGTSVGPKATTLARLSACGTVLAAIALEGLTLSSAEVAALSTVTALAEAIAHAAGITVEALEAATA